MSFICQYCNSRFKNKYKLSNHINTAKYCNEIRKGINLKCVCGYTFSTKYTLKDHQNICVPYIKELHSKEKSNIIDEYEKKLQEERNRYERLSLEIAKKS